MNIHEYLTLPENEKPLDRIVTDGGFTPIFRTIACIGDSLSSGEFESRSKDGKDKGYHDMFEYSWGQFMARSGGYHVYNFSRGGMTAKEYIESFAEAKGFWDEDRLSQAYIMALGVNDLLGRNMEVGTVSDFEAPDDNHPETFAYYYGKIIERIRRMRPDAYFFLMTMPRESTEPHPKREAHRELLLAFAKKLSRTYVIDLYTYAPIYDAEFNRRFFLGHMNPMGYLLTARMVESYIDYLIRHNPEDFNQVPFISTDLWYHKPES